MKSIILTFTLPPEKVALKYEEAYQGVIDTVFFTDKELTLINYDHKHPKIYAEFRKLALEAISGGVTRSGANRIIEVLRWENEVRAKGEVYKINNNQAPYYARKFIWEYPQHKDFFAMRESKKGTE
tara:strand:- start:809 stop:1186 length:378 start_codon:yes stop_codon:yes gene_type:complete